MPAHVALLGRLLLWTAVTLAWLSVTPAVFSQAHFGLKAGSSAAGWYQNVSVRESATGTPGVRRSSIR